MAFNGIGRFTIARGATMPLDGWFFPNGADLGAQYFSANPTFDTFPGTLLMFDESKARHPGGGVSYGFTVRDTNDPQADGSDFFDVQGGGFINGFNGAGRFTIARADGDTPTVMPINGWFFGNGEDHGAQYFSANPLDQNDVQLFMSQQNKSRNPIGPGVTYGFTVTNRDPNADVSFDVQGGGFSGGFNGVGRATLGPGAPPQGFTATFGNGDDHGAQFIAANPIDSAGSMLIAADQAKARALNGAVSYSFTIENTDTVFPAVCDFQGGGFV